MKDILLTADLNNSDSISFSMQSKLLYSINNWIINDSRYITGEDIQSVFLPLLRGMTPIIHATLSYLLLEVTTRVLLLYNNLGGGGNSGQLNHEDYIGDNGKQVDAIADDSLICGILERAPQDESGNEDIF